MDAGQILTFAALVSIWLTVWSLGAQASPRDVTHLLMRPKELAPSLLAIFGLTPLLAIAIAGVLPIALPAKFAIIAMSVAPVPPVLPFKQMKAGATQSYAVGLLVAASVVAVIATPLLVLGAAAILGSDAVISPAVVARSVCLSIALPLGLGVLMKALLPRFTERLRRPLQRVGVALLIVAFGAILASVWREVLDLVGGGALLAMAAGSAAGVITGHVLAPEEHRRALAIASGCRHPGVALAIGTANFPEARAELLAAVLLYFIVSALITSLYVRLIGRLEPAAHGAAE
jgi:BASS family bile acid:Na+ symporter